MPKKNKRRKKDLKIYHDTKPQVGDRVELVFPFSGAHHLNGLRGEIIGCQGEMFLVTASVKGRLKSIPAGMSNIRLIEVRERG